MDTVTNLEQLVQEKRHNYELANHAVGIVAKFIQDRDLILYGGQAIDYALRLKGDKLYEDWQTPDFDFLSHQHVHESVRLMKILLSDPLYVRDASVGNQYAISLINAFHPTTVRVRIEQDMVADISYIPKRVFNLTRKTCLLYNPSADNPDKAAKMVGGAEYCKSQADHIMFQGWNDQHYTRFLAGNDKGILIRHPFFQFADMHRSFSFPMEGALAMMENIVNRWTKDYVRMMKLMSHYPPQDYDKFIEKYGKPTKIPDQGIIIVPDLGPICGDVAYRIYKKLFQDSLSGPQSKSSPAPGLKKPIKLDLKKLSGKNLFWISAEDSVHLTEDINISLAKLAKHKLPFTNLGDYRVSTPFLDIIPPRYVSNKFEFITLEHKTGIHTIKLSDLDKKMPNTEIQLVTIQYLALYMMLKWISTKNSIYLKKYMKINNMIWTINNQESRSKILELFLPSINLIGQEMEHIFKRQKVTPPTQYFVNEYNPANKILAEIQDNYEYSEHYDLTGEIIEEIKKRKSIKAQKRKINQ